MDNLILIREFYNRLQAELTVEMLCSFGIESSIIADDCGGAAPGQSFVRGVKVYVSEKDAKAAFEILRRKNDSE